MKLPVEVMDAVRQRRCVIFVGSRASLESAELEELPWPDHKELAKRLGWKAPRPQPGSKGRAAIPSVEEGAQDYEARNGREKLLASLREWIGQPPKATAAHQGILQHFPLIFTTCLDDLLEQSAASTSRSLTVMQRNEPIPSQLPTTEQLLVRLRGRLDLPQSVLISRSDLEKNPLSVDNRKALRTLIRNNVIFFVGYRPDEEEFERLFAELSDAYGGELPRCHLAVAQGAIDDYLWQKWVWRGLLLFMADPTEAIAELNASL